VTSHVEVVKLIEELKHRLLDFTLTTWNHICQNEQFGVSFMNMTSMNRFILIASWTQYLGTRKRACNEGDEGGGWRKKTTAFLGVVVVEVGMKRI